MLLLRMMRAGIMDAQSHSKVLKAHDKEAGHLRAHGLSVSGARLVKHVPGTPPDELAFWEARSRRRRTAPPTTCSAAAFSW